jgi:hypothetical protein
VYEYSHEPPGQPYLVYWTEHEQLPPTLPQQQQFMADLHTLLPQHPPQPHHYLQQRPQALMLGTRFLLLPPGESDVAGYREVLPPSSDTNAGAAEAAQHEQLDQEEIGNEESKGSCVWEYWDARADHSPSPMLKPATGDVVIMTLP